MITHILRNAILSPVEVFQPTGCVYIDNSDNMFFDDIYLKCLTSDWENSSPFYVARTLSELHEKVDIIDFASKYKSSTGILEVPYWGKLVIYADPAAFSEFKAAAFNAFFKSNPAADLRLIDNLFQIKNIYLNNIKSGHRAYHPGLDIPIKKPLDIPSKDYPLEMKMGLWLMDPNNADKEEDFRKDLQYFIDIRGAEAILHQFDRVTKKIPIISELPGIEKYPLLAKLKGIKQKSDKKIKKLYLEIFGNHDDLIYFTHPRKTIRAATQIPPDKKRIQALLAISLEMIQHFYEGTPIAKRLNMDRMRLDYMTEFFPSLGEDIFKWEKLALLNYLTTLDKVCALNSTYMTYIWNNRKNKSVLEKCCPVS